MFDSVFFPCPACGNQVEAQSKSGDCNGTRYWYESVPFEVAQDVNRHAPFKCWCGQVTKLLVIERVILKTEK